MNPGILGSSIVIHEGNGHLETFSLPEAEENSRQICFSEQIFYRKQFYLSFLHESGRLQGTAVRDFEDALQHIKRCVAGVSDS